MIQFDLRGRFLQLLPKQVSGVFSIPALVLTVTLAALMPNTAMSQNAYIQHTISFPIWLAWRISPTRIW